MDEKEYKATEIQESFMEFKREIAKGAENSRTGKAIPQRVIAQFEAAEKSKDREVEKVRLKNINLRTHLKKLEQHLRAKEQLAEGLHLIDFEQLKIENQTLNEKIEERNEELHKLRKKTTETVQVLTHIKEKLQFVHVENQTLKKNLEGIEDELTNQRNHLTKTKQERDATRASNAELRRKQGFANSGKLVDDFEKRNVRHILKCLILPNSNGVVGPRAIRKSQVGNDSKACIFAGSQQKACTYEEKTNSVKNIIII